MTRHDERTDDGHGHSRNLPLGSSGTSRRTVLTALAASGAAASVGNIVGAQEDEPDTIVLLGPTPGWIGVEPEGIEDEENPTLDLEAGRAYEVTWENSDGLPHNFAILSADGEQLVRSEVIEELGAEQTVEFEATEEMAEYYCELHPDTMRGDIAIDGEQPEEADPDPLAEIPVAGNFPEGERIGLEKVAEDLPGLTGLEYIEGDDENRNFIVTQTGQVYAHSEDAAEAGPEADTDEEDTTATDVATPDDMELFLDLSDRIVDLGILDLQEYDERGLLGLGFHPDFEENGRLYVRYSGELREGTPEEYDHTDVLAEFQANDDGTADPDSERILMEIPQPQDNHNGGALEFGPDGYLYTAVGDGGNVHDIGLGHVEDWYDENEGGNGQDTQENLLGGILRIDVDAETDAEAQGPDDGAYEIPEDNPLVDLEGHLEEYYAWGFRNPWGMTVQDDGTIFVADAGQHLIESVYIVELGGNYGWNVKEGSVCFSPETPIDPPEECPDETPEDVRGGEPLRDPIAEYQHQRGTEAFIDSSVVVGGYRYDGEAIPELQGKYVFGNWSSEGVVAPDGELLTVTPPEEADAEPNDDEMDNRGNGMDDNHGNGMDDNHGNGMERDNDDVEPDDESETVGPFPDRWDLEELAIENAENESLNRYVYNVMRDEEGELYVLANSDYRPEVETGEIYKIVPAEEGEDVPAPEDAATIDHEEPAEDDENDEDAPPAEEGEDDAMAETDD